MLGNTNPRMLGDIPQAMLPEISPGSIVGCKGATDPDCILEPIPEAFSGFIPESMPGKSLRLDVEDRKPGQRSSPQ